MTNQQDITQEDIRAKFTANAEEFDSLLVQVLEENKRLHAELERYRAAALRNCDNCVRNPTVCKKACLSRTKHHKSIRDNFLLKPSAK